MAEQPILRNEGALAEAIPDIAVSEGSASMAIRAFEVVLAHNVYPPYRYSQDYYWLEVLASDETAALKTAVEWALRQEGVPFEATDLVRPATEHFRYMGQDAAGKPMSIFWNLPIDEALQPQTMIRNPVTGIRVGFIAGAEAEARWLPEEAKGLYRLILRKPTETSQPVGLAPLVRNASPLRHG